MTRTIRTQALLATLILSLPWLGACSDKPASTGADAATEATEDDKSDVVARVGDQTIYFHELNTMINSSAIIGLSMPELGSPERDVVRLTLLDKMISGNLLYLDALQKGVDQDPEYQRSMAAFTDGILARLYRSRFMRGDIEVTEQDVQDFYDNNIVQGTEFTEELKAGIEATIRKQRYKEKGVVMRKQLREGHKTAINVTDLNPADDQVRNDTEVVAEVDGEELTWGMMRSALQTSRTRNSVQARIDALERYIDNRLMTRKAKELGLEQDPVFLARFREFSKTRLINLHRDRLLASMEPTDEEIRAYYDENKEAIIVPEVRKVQMLVVETEDEAAALKKRIAGGDLTFHRAVADYSIVPDAKKTLGQIGWVSENTGFPELDEVTFLLEAGEISDPVESPAGWHVVRIVDQRDAHYKNPGDHQTKRHVRKLLLDHKLDQYVVGLREQGSFAISIDDENFTRLAQQEVDWYEEMKDKAMKSPEEVLEEIKKLKK